MKDNRTIIMLLVVVVVLAGVIFVFVGGWKPGEDTEVAAIPNTEVAQQELIVGEATVEVISEATPTSEMEVLVPTPREGLSATDPGTVDLVSGEIQLVEAFAFW